MPESNKNYREKRKTNIIVELHVYSLDVQRVR